MCNCGNDSVCGPAVTLHASYEFICISNSERLASHLCLIWLSKSGGSFCCFLHRPDNVSYQDFWLRTCMQHNCCTSLQLNVNCQLSMQSALSNKAVTNTARSTADARSSLLGVSNEGSLLGASEVKAVA